MLLALRDEIRSLEKELIRDGGFPSVSLMETAGRELSADIVEFFGGRFQAVRVVCGRGNNGGDGFVIARYLREAGWRVRVHVVGLADELSSDAALYARLFRWSGGGIEEHPDGKIPAALAGELQIDAILGTGLDRELSGPYALAVERLNESSAEARVPIYSVDIPTGLDADTGAVLGTAVTATATGALGIGKPGLYITPGHDFAGRVKVLDIGLPKASQKKWAKTARFLVEDESILTLRRRPFAGHKGTFGHVLVFAGSASMAGAADLTCRGAVRAGAGLVTLSAPAAVRAMWPEVMHQPIEAWEESEWKDDFLHRKQALVFGPGVGMSEGAQSFLMRLVEAPLPLVLDADGLNLLAQRPHLLAERQAPTILTPHPAEAARLLGLDIEFVQADRPKAALSLAKQYGSAIVLKGARTIIAMPEGNYWVNGSGSPSMAAGGMGDVLSGIIAAQLSAGMPVEKAACVGVFVHGRAAERLGCKAGGLRASEVADAVPAELEHLVSAESSGAKGGTK